jgi:hypothetical protein
MSSTLGGEMEGSLLASTRLDQKLWNETLVLLSISLCFFEQVIYIFSPLLKQVCKGMDHA